MDMPEVLVVFGPTASGKTGASIAIAEAVDGEVINGDSRQVYEKMRIISAAPDEAEKGRVAHHLFEFIDPAERMSAQRWSEMCCEAIEGIFSRGKVPIVVGGTGLYLRSLMEGLSEVPAIPLAVEDEFRGMPVEELYRQLSEVDLMLAAKLNPNDTQRITRGLVVYTHTGTPLSKWQAMPGKVPPYAFKKLGLSPERELLYARIEARWGKMLERGVVEEIRHLKDEGYTLDMPGLQGLGIAEIYDYLDSRLSLEDAGKAAVQGTRHYAKRQVTWLRNTFKAEQEFGTGAELVDFVKAFRLY